MSQPVLGRTGTAAAAPILNARALAAKPPSLPSQGGIRRLGRALLLGGLLLLNHPLAAGAANNEQLMKLLQRGSCPDCKLQDADLVQAVAQTHATLKMPPSGKLDDASIGAIREWVKAGAVWPDGPKGKPYSVSAEQKQWWAFQPVKSPAVPAVKNKAWVKSPVDSFILAALEIGRAHV